MRIRLGELKPAQEDFHGLCLGPQLILLAIFQEIFQLSNRYGIILKIGENRLSQFDTPLNISISRLTFI